MYDIWKKKKCSGNVCESKFEDRTFLLHAQCMGVVEGKCPLHAESGSGNDNREKWSGTEPYNALNEFSPA